MPARVYIAYILLCIFNGIYSMSQNACNEDKNVLNSCDGSIVSNNNIYMDFGVIKSQCSCTVEPINNVDAFYLLSKNPGYNDCGTGIQITQSNNDIQILKCSNGSPGIVFTNLSTNVEFRNDNSFVSGNDEYCLSVISNNVSHIVKGSCGTSVTNSPMTSTDLSRNATKIISTHSTVKDTGRTEAFTSTSNSYPVEETSIPPGNTVKVTTIKDNLILIIVVAAGALLILIVIIALTVKVFRHRDKNKILNMPLKDKVTDDLYSQRVHLQPENVLLQSTESNKTPNPHPSSNVDNRNSGLWVVENTFYQSADNVTNDNEDDSNDKELEVGNTVYYSEIKDNENKGTTKVNVDLVYDYAHVIDKMS
uniref:Uncharacterized protein LOC111102839 isoform X3 n=1 Tax=Crassostrea virginica TaxID=6565 RepID=A0A8B8AJU7_CRAVI|nr:uncharacterized protein LOC111102839 isoform X3 [Crassostrea virginica]